MFRVWVASVVNTLPRPKLSLRNSQEEASISNSRGTFPHFIHIHPIGSFRAFADAQMSLIGRRFLSTTRQIVPPKIATPNVTQPQDLIDVD